MERTRQERNVIKMFFKKRNTAVKKLLNEINQKLSTAITLLKYLVDKTAKSSERPLAWLNEEYRPEAEALRAEDPERYDYAMKILKLFFS